jgi:hypothetical protein
MQIATNVSPMGAVPPQNLFILSSFALLVELTEATSTALHPLASCAKLLRRYHSVLLFTPP